MYQESSIIGLHIINRPFADKDAMKIKPLIEPKRLEADFFSRLHGLICHVF